MNARETEALLSEARARAIVETPWEWCDLLDLSMTPLTKEADRGVRLLQQEPKLIQMGAYTANIHMGWHLAKLAGPLAEIAALFPADRDLDDAPSRLEDVAAILDRYNVPRPKTTD